MVKAASHIGGISNEPSVISPLHLLQQRLDVCQKLEGESVIFLLHLVGGLSQKCLGRGGLLWGCQEAARPGEPHTGVKVGGQVNWMFPLQ